MATAATDNAAASAQQAQTSPRKRRRRAPTTGAADDCFTCRDRAVACDRRRPYCSQCLDLKVTCSGYKTQLTWGVGVASRGKLRGLSLPVAKSKPAAGAGEKPAARKKGAGAGAGAGSSKKGQSTPASATSTPSSAQSQTPMSMGSIPSTAATSVSYSFVGVSPNVPAQSAPPFQTQFEWHNQPKFVSSDLRTQPMRSGMQPSASGQRVSRPLKRQSLHLDTSDISPYMHQQSPSHPMSAQPALGDPYISSAYDSPTSPQPYGPVPTHHSQYGSVSSHPTQTMHYHNMTGSNPGSAPLQPPNSWPSNYPSPSSVSDTGSHVSTPDFAFATPAYPDASIGAAADQLLAMQHPQSYMSHNALSYGPIDAIREDDEVEEEIKREDTASPLAHFGRDVLRMNQTFNSHERVGNTPELRYLINYYLEVLTPVILAFDGPGNPWRDHVLALARSSEGLQHAIAALSASNLRMRREHKDDKPRLPPTGDSVHDVSVRKSTEAHERLNDEVEPPELSVPGAPSARETYHKTQSIRALNKQLADPSKRSDDSIVAILLVICLYHMCETGVARFRTQFAGVKRIMSLRSQRQAPSKEINWMITFFKWFDAMVATVNDRECQFPEESAFFPTSDEDWGLENLAGCDSRLFATVSRLGRLNVLSQGRNTGATDTNVQPPFFSPVAGPQAPYMHPDLTFDLSGWAQLSPAQSVAAPVADTRSQFWTEWAQVRQALIDWSFDSSYLPNSMRNTAISYVSANGMNASMDGKSVADISNISESFRHASLLYTERLAYPNLPSASPQFQDIVQTALYYIKLVQSDVCLLWPLFIVGTEAIREEDRRAIRNRCWEIQKDSGFYNNIKTLELLEVIWDRTDKEGRGGNVGGTGTGWDDLPHGTEAFRWRKEMMTSEGEYIVI